jgi:hypothetical protein
MNKRAASAAATGLAFLFLTGAGGPLSAVKVNVVVAQAAVNGTQIDPKLEHFARDMKHQKFSYTSFTVASEASFNVDLGKSGEVKLPSGRTVTVEFRQVDTDGKFRIKVHAPQRGYVTVSRSPGKELFFQADTQRGGPDTWLVLTLAEP